MGIKSSVSYILMPCLRIYKLGLQRGLTDIDAVNAGEKNPPFCPQMAPECYICNYNVSRNKQTDLFNTLIRAEQ